MGICSGAGNGARGGTRLFELCSFDLREGAIMRHPFCKFRLEAAVSHLLADVVRSDTASGKVGAITKVHSCDAAL